MELPLEYVNRMKRLLGSEADLYFDALDREPERAFRQNRIKMPDLLPDIPEIKSIPSEMIPGVFFFTGAAGGKNPLHHAGAYYIQELSAMLPLACFIETVNPLPGFRALDLCASPGGKTGQIAEALTGVGTVVSNEYSAKRARVLLGNIERMGYRNCAVYNSSPDVICRSFSGYFDLVLADAPCSGEGMFRKEPWAVSDWSPETSAGCAARQYGILKCAADAVKPGGYLLYSTCTFSPDEDENVIAEFLESDKRFRMIKMNVPDGVAGLAAGLATGISDGRGTGLATGISDGRGTELCMRAYPHRLRGEGQFFGLMQRDDSPVCPSNSVEKCARPYRRGRKTVNTGTDVISPLSASEKRAANEFLTGFFGDVPDNDISDALCAFRGEIFISSQGAGLPTENLIAPGVRLGNLAPDGRLIPHHHFFSAFGKYAAIKAELEPNGGLIARYLHGESLDAAECGLRPDLSGYGVITVCGCPVGGFRLSGGQAKNLYPKGLRI